MLRWPGSMRENRKYCGSTRRTVLCMFGTVTFSRRLVRREGEKPFYPLDNILGLSPYQRYSPLLLYSVTKVAAGSVYRAATEAVNTLTPLDISHQTVGRMVRTVGDKYAQYEEAQADQAFCSEGSLKKPLFVPHVGVHQCCIANYGPSSSPMGHLAAVLNW